MHSVSYFENLPSETILDVAMEMPVDDIKTLCKTCTRFNSVIGDNQTFWRKRLEREFLERQLKKFTFIGESWKEKCASYMNKYIELQFQCLFGSDMYACAYIIDSRHNRNAVERLKDIVNIPREIYLYTADGFSLDEVNASVSGFQWSGGHDVEEVVLIEGPINVPVKDESETPYDWFIKNYEYTTGPTWSKMGNVIMENS